MYQPEGAAVNALDATHTQAERNAGMTGLVLALDQGTTSSRAIVFDRSGTPLAAGNRAFEQMFPRPGWVEHDPETIWRSQMAAARDALGSATTARVTALGIANQRETTLIWDRLTGEPIHNAIVWQDRRTTSACDALKAAGYEPDIRQRTGLTIDPYFSATKIRWLLDTVDGARDRAKRGTLAFGTVDTWLVWRLTGGRVHVTDVSNASRTMLLNQHTREWDDDILRELRIPRSLLPEIVASSGVVGHTQMEYLDVSLPIAGVVGDQQAATFGQGCFDVGMAKQTYGTGSFMLMNVGTRPRQSEAGLLSTVAWRLDGETTYALEGSSFAAGAGVQWLRDELGIISTAAETDDLARSVESTGDVYFVPAFVGLGAPHWDARARGALVGLTRGTGRAEIARAVLEAVAYQTRDVLEAMERDAAAPLAELRVDGGMVENEFLMQFQADILNRRVARPAVAETTASGAAYLAGLATGVWHDVEDIRANWRLDRAFEPRMSVGDRERLYRRWQQAVDRSRSWAEEAAE
ncbi:MAG TPA: glycerol kinase GlpK [Thermomicrobiales bacterium]|nr:glycerol kinase GlpK [Thermomicrobiales bacterium]